MKDPINRITLRYENTGGTRISVEVYISDAGDLVVDGCDYGEAPKKIWKDSDYEYVTTIKKEFKDTILLLLIQDNFKDSYDFREWLKRHDIPNDFWSWA